MDDNDNESVCIELNGKKCEVRAYLSMSDLGVVQKNVSEYNNDYRLFVAEIIASHTDDIFSTAEIAQLEDSVFEKYIILCLSEDEKLERNFNSLDEQLSIFERFILAAKATSEEYGQQIRSEYKDSILPAVSKAAEATAKISENYLKNIAPI